MHLARSADAARAVPVQSPCGRSARVLPTDGLRAGSVTSAAHAIPQPSAKLGSDLEKALRRRVPEGVTLDAQPGLELEWSSRVHTPSFRSFFSAALLAALVACEEDTTTDPTPEPFDECDGDSVRTALSNAEAGDSVVIGACAVAGPFIVPAGVTLSGQGKTASTIEVASADVGVELSSGAVLRELRVNSAGAAAVVAREQGALTVISGVEVHATLGIGIGAEDVPLLVLSEVVLTGPVTSANVDDVSGTATTLETATHGLVLVNVGTAALSDVEVSGFADFGVLAIESTVVWTGGGASGNRGTGAMFEGGDVNLQDLAFCGTMRGQRQLPPYGAIVSSIVEGVGSPTGTATHVDFCDNEGVGLLLNKASSFELRGSDATPASISGNVAAGLLVLDSENLVLADVEVTGTTAGELPLGEDDAILPLGDGVHLVRTSQGIDFTNVSATENERVGLLLDIGPEVDVGPDVMDPSVKFLKATWTNVFVEAAPPDGFGARCQGDFDDPGGQKKSWGSTDEDDWDYGIDRDALATTQDIFPDENTDFVSIVAAGNPCNMPEPGAIAFNGLMAVGVP